MTGRQITEHCAELVCDRDGNSEAGADQTVESLRDTLAQRGWAFDVATTETTKPYRDLCPDCCEVVTVVEAVVL